MPTTITDLRRKESRERIIQHLLNNKQRYAIAAGLLTVTNKLQKTNNIIDKKEEEPNDIDNGKRDIEHNGNNTDNSDNTPTDSNSDIDTSSQITPEES